MLSLVRTAQQDSDATVPRDGVMYARKDDKGHSTALGTRLHIPDAAHVRAGVIQRAWASLKRDRCASEGRKFDVWGSRMGGVGSGEREAVKTREGVRD